jgi:nitrate reductase gamma subunit
MNKLYLFLIGPGVWGAVLICLGGLLTKGIYLALLARKQDPVVYEYMNPRFATRSLWHWLIPYSSTNMRQQPLFTLISFSFHICLLITPLFCLSHVILWHEAWGIGWWTLPGGVADTMTIVVISACLYFFVRRLVQRDVAYLTTPLDLVLVVLVGLPFVTGFWAQHFSLAGQWMSVLHVLSGELLLIAIPFTRLSHLLFFFLTRSYMGSEFGAVRHARDW